MSATPPPLANPRRRQAPSSSLARCPPSPHPRGRTRSKAPPPRASPPDPRHSAAFFSSLPHPRSGSEILLLGSGGGSCTRRRSIQRIGRRKPDPEGENPSLSLSLKEEVSACVLYKDPLRKFLVRLVSSYRYGSDHVDEELARAEAAELHGAVVSKKEALHGDVVRIVSSRSKPQLRATFQRYKQDHSKAIDEEVMRSLAETMLCCCGTDYGRLWRRVVLRKWLNVGAGSGDSDFSADEGDEDEGEPDHQDNCFCEHNLNDEERRLGGLGAGTIDQEIVIGAVVIKILPGKQVNNFSGNSYQGYESREVAEEKWRRHGRKKWRNFLVITTLFLFMVGYVFYFI